MSSVICEDETEALRSEGRWNIPNELSRSFSSELRPARAQCLQSKPWKCGFQEEERQKSEAGGRFWISDKLLHLQCRGVFQFLGKVFYSTHHTPLRCPSLTFFFASIVMENNQVSFLFIYLLCKQPGETNSRVILEESEHSLATFRGCRNYLQKTWAGGWNRL